MALSSAEVTTLKAILQTAKKGYAAPPWVRYPTMPYGYGFWRMGGGESHLMEWGAWLHETLTEGQRLLYQRAFPSPRSWNVFGPNYYDQAEEDAEEQRDDEAEMGSREKVIAARVGITLWSLNGKPLVCSREALLEEGAAANAKREFLFFWGHTQKPGALTSSVLSQWWRNPSGAAGDAPAVQFSEGADDYVCAEQYMMAGKAMIFDDDQTRERILHATDPAAIKKLGRQVKGFDPEVWGVVAFSIVAQGNYLKFISDARLKEFLLGTGDAVLVEASPYDTVWGIGQSVDGARKQKIDLKDVRHWKGDNLLGFALMEVREEIGRVFRYAHFLDKQP